MLYLHPIGFTPFGVSTRSQVSFFASVRISSAIAARQFASFATSTSSPSQALPSPSQALGAVFSTTTHNPSPRLPTRGMHDRVFTTRRTLHLTVQTDSVAHSEHLAEVRSSSEFGLESEANTMTQTHRTQHRDLCELVWFGGYNTYNPYVRPSSRPRCTSRLSRPTSSVNPSAHAHMRCYQKPLGVVDSASF